MSRCPDHGVHGKMLHETYWRTKELEQRLEFLEKKVKNMNVEQAISRMVAPGERRPRKFLGGVIQVWLTRACNLSCYGCTQASNLAGNPGMISVRNFEKACQSLKDYWGVVGIFGGNPALHPEFEILCSIMRDIIPKRQRGLWCNHPMGKGRAMRETFNPAVSNLNVHLDQRAYDEFKRDWPECKPFGLKQDCRHSSPYVAIKDLMDNDEVMWEAISDCDINKHWSAMICEVEGEAKAYFCEIAGSQAMLRNDGGTGMDVEPGWWNRPIQDFSEQIKRHCPSCGVPLRAYGELAQAEDGTEYTTATWQDIRPKRKERDVCLVTELHQIKPERLSLFTDYMGNARR
jgi:hypothetical protein